MALKNKREVERALDKVEKDLIKYLKPFDINSRLAQTKMRQQMQGGTTATKLRKRSGKLQASVKPVKAKFVDKGIKAGITIGTIYSSLHIGKRGETTIIRPKNKQYLTVPLPAALTAAGVLRGSARDESVYGKTFIIRSKNNNLIIMGGKGGRTVPLFVLKKQVTVKKRIDPADIIKYIKPKLIKDIERVKL